MILLILLIATLVALTWADLTLVVTDGRACPTGAVDLVSHDADLYTFAIRDFYALNNYLASAAEDRVKDCRLQLALTDTPMRHKLAARHATLRGQGSFSTNSGMNLTVSAYWTKQDELIQMSNSNRATYVNTESRLVVGPAEIGLELNNGEWAPGTPCGAASDARLNINLRLFMFRGNQSAAVAQIGPKIASSGEVLGPVRLLLKVMTAAC